MVVKRIALIQPLFPRGKSLGIQKAPESIMVLAGLLEKLGYCVCMFHEAVGAKLQEEIEFFSPDFVGISTMTPNFPEGRRIAMELKLWRPKLPIALGGWHASGCVHAYLSGQENESIRELLNPCSPFDYVVAGEGEEALPYLLRCLVNDSPIQPGNGISFFNDGQMWVNPSVRVKNLEQLPWPSWSGLNVGSYRDQRSGALDLSVHFNRSCRFKCGFCSTPVVYGQGVRTIPAREAVEYIEYLVERFRPQVITFTDEDFFAQPRWVDELVGLLKNRNFASKYGVSFDTFASVNDLHRYREQNHAGFLDRMTAAGFRSFTIGIESFNPEVLIRYNKEQMILPMMSREERRAYAGLELRQKRVMLVKHYHQRVQEAINFACEHDLLVVGDYMIGNLGESVADVRMGFKMFKRLHNLVVAYIPVFTPFPGTSVWAEAYSSGCLPRLNDGGINWGCFDASSGVIDQGYDVAAIRNEMEIQFYTSDRYWEDMNKMLHLKPESRAMFEGRFNYLDREFPGDPRIQQMILLLS